MNQLNAKLVITTTTVFAAVVYAVCVAVHCTLLIPNLASYTTPMLEATFPGFSWTLGGVILGLVEIMLYAAIGSAFYVWLYNLFAAHLRPAKI